jgi:hypothetical protein
MLVDYNQQSVRNFSQEELEKNLSLFIDINLIPKQNLSVNCRNIKSISDKTKKYTGFGTEKVKKELQFSIDEKEFDIHPWKNMEEQTKLLEKLIDKLLSKNINKNDILILSTLRRQEDSVISRVSFNFKKYEVKPTNIIRFSSIKKYKGLESPVAIITDIDTYTDTHLLYQGMSRATTLLLLLDSENARRELKEKGILE